MVFLNFLGINKRTESRPKSYIEMTRAEIEQVIKNICLNTNSAAEIVSQIKEKLKFEGRLDVASSIDGHIANIFMQTNDKKLLEFHAKTKADITQN